MTKEIVVFLKPDKKSVKKVRKTLKKLSKAYKKANHLQKKLAFQKVKFKTSHSS